MLLESLFRGAMVAPSGILDTPHHIIDIQTSHSPVAAPDPPAVQRLKIKSGQAFSVRAPRLWSDLPEGRMLSESLAPFKLL